MSRRAPDAPTPAEHRLDILVPLFRRLPHLLPDIELLLKLQTLELLPHALLQFAQRLRVLHRALPAKALLPLDGMLVLVLRLELMRWRRLFFRRLATPGLAYRILELMVSESVLRHALHGGSSNACDCLHRIRHDGGDEARLEASGIRRSLDAVIAGL